MMLAAVTLLPAVIGAGRPQASTAGSVPSLIHHPDRDRRAGRDPSSRTFWERWARARRPRTSGRSRSSAWSSCSCSRGRVLSMRLGESERRQPPHLDHPASGVRSRRPGVRAGHQRPVAGRRLSCPSVATTPCRRHRRRHREDAERRGRASPAAQHPDDTVAAIGVRPRRPPPTAQATDDLVARRCASCRCVAAARSAQPACRPTWAA